MAGPTREFWEKRFQSGETPWDRGAANPQLGAWLAFDAIYEQTCLCALYPDRWRQYADQLHRWLAPGGRLYALFPEPRWLWRFTLFVDLSQGSGYGPVGR